MTDGDRASVGRVIAEMENYVAELRAGYRDMTARRIAEWQADLKAALLLRSRASETPPESQR